jgi:hypothetical protein
MNYAERTYTSVKNARGEVLRIGEAVPPRPARIEGHAVIVQSALLKQRKHDPVDRIVMRGCGVAALALVAMGMAGWLS